MKRNEKAFHVPLSTDDHVYPRGFYNPFPEFSISGGFIGKGYPALAGSIDADVRVLCVDGFNGVNWEQFQSSLEKSLSDIGKKASWFNMNDVLLPEEVIYSRIESFIGEGDPLFGRNYPFGPEVFFDPVKIADYRSMISAARAEGPGELLIFGGCGAGLLELWDKLWYVDLPKDYIQIRARKGEVKNLGNMQASAFSEFYKRSYFVDWPALNRLKKRLLPDIDMLVDSTEELTPGFITGSDFREALHEVSGNPFRVRPWFSPGPWGGKFMQGHMGLDSNLPNIAWSFEEIVPENGIVLEWNGKQLEFSFDWLMFGKHKRVLGKAAGAFGYEWPIRFDYLDTIDGGNLSTQVHPRPDFIRKKFGETYTQDETYYIVNSKGDSRVYLGLNESCEPEEFRTALEESAENGTELDIDRFVNSEPSNPHDLFLIPNGTVHCGGTGNLVLEISATPYIFTFKIYDYMRRDLDGNLRPLNIERAFENIRFERKAGWVRKNLLAVPRLFRQGEGWKDFILYDKPYSFYNIHRLEFSEKILYDTEGRGLSLNLVDGEQVSVVSKGGRTEILSRYETMLVPSAAESIEISNLGKEPCRLILVYVRPGAGDAAPLNNPC